MMKHLALLTLFSSTACSLLRRQSQPDDQSRALSIRQNENDGQTPFELTRDSAGGYFVEISLGGSQTMTVQIRSDTYFSWVPASNSSTCVEGSCEHGSFNIGMSPTYANRTDRTDFMTVAVPGTEGIWFTDILNVGDLSDVNLTMGLAYDLVNPYGALGLQYKPSASRTSVWNVMAQMVSQGAAVTQAYSLSVGSPDSQNGSILFGAIDTEKYIGDLASLDCYFLSDADFRTVVTLASVQANSSSGVDDLADGLPVSTGIWVGRPGLFLPPELAFNMWAVAGAEYWSDLGAATVPCSMKESDGSFTFGLAGDEGPKVTVPMRSLVAPQSGLGPNCVFLVNNETNPANYYLGEAFLQNVYAVFDLANQKVAVATPRPDSADSNIVPFAGVAAPIPSTVSVSSQLTRPVTESPTLSELPTATKSFSAAAGFQSTSTTTLTPPPTSDPETSTTNTTAIGIGVGVGVGVAALGVIGAIFFFKRRQSRKTEPVPDKSTDIGLLSTGFPASEYTKYNPTELDPQYGIPELHPDARPIEVNGTPFHDYQGGAYVELPSTGTISPYRNSNNAGV